MEVRFKTHCVWIKKKRIRESGQALSRLSACHVCMETQV